MEAKGEDFQGFADLLHIEYDDEIWPGGKGDNGGVGGGNSDEEDDGLDDLLEEEVFDEENAVITTVDSNEAEIKPFEEFDTKVGKLGDKEEIQAEENVLVGKKRVVIFCVEEGGHPSLKWFKGKILKKLRGTMCYEVKYEDGVNLPFIFNGMMYKK